jgi:signal transduction histidine kinase
MKLVTRIFLTYALLLALVIGGAGLTAYSAHQTKYEIARSDLSNGLHQRYLNLSNHAYQLFKQFGDAILIGDRDLGHGETELLALIEDDFIAIRHVIGREVELVGEEEIEEYSSLAGIERLLRELIAEHYAILELKRGGAPVAELSARLIRLHDEAIDKDFNRLMRDAIAEEAREAVQIQSGAARRMDLLDMVTLTYSLIALVVIVLAVWRLVRDTRGPLDALLSGADALAHGRLDHRIDAVGPVELLDLAHAFNHMAGEIARREAAIADQNRDLEQTVAGRTAELGHAIEVLKTSEVRRRQLLADVSHELRTPLTVIRGEADIALRGVAKPEAEYREALERVRSAAGHCARIVDDLLSIARREAGEAKLQLEEVDLAVLLPRLIADVGELAPYRQVHLEYHGSVDQGLVRVDPHRIRQILLILIENAVHYGGNEVRIGLERVPSGYLVSVVDNGAGMSEVDLKQAFERFFRGPDAARRYEHGTGLGLPVARALVEAHGGEIDLRGEPGQGLTAVFTLPTRPRLKAVS